MEAAVSTYTAATPNVVLVSMRLVHSELIASLMPDLSNYANPVRTPIGEI